MLINKRICIIFSVKTAFIHILVTALLYILQLHPLPFSFHPLCIRLVPHQFAIFLHAIYLLYIFQLHPFPFSFHPLCIRLVPHQWCPTIKGDKVSAALVKSAHRSNTRWSNDAL